MHKLTAAVAFLMLLGLAGCGGSDRVEGGGESGRDMSNAAPVEAGPLPAEKLEMPVQIGELGPSFRACASRGTFLRVVSEASSVEVRAAPFETSRTIADLPANASFFICARSHDQKWLGIVFDEAGTAAPECGVTAPVPSRRDYAGPCRSGWVTAAVVRSGS